MLNKYIGCISKQITERIKDLDKIELSYALSTSKNLEKIYKNGTSFMAYIEREQQFLKELNKSLIKEDIFPDCEIDAYKSYKQELTDMFILQDYILNEVY
jgi:hypothetical protein